MSVSGACEDTSEWVEQGLRLGEALWKRWSISPCEDGWHQQPEAYRMKAAFMAGLAAMQKETQ
jgi:hypothetical protein